MNDPLCYICHQPLKMAKRPRHNFASTADCIHCHLRHYIHFEGGDKTDWSVQNINKRFSYNGTVWHMTYRPKDDKTTFVKVMKIDRTALADLGEMMPTSRQEHTVIGLVLPDRFINLITFL